jgi:hypothetical protein
MDLAINITDGSWKDDPTRDPAWVERHSTLQAPHGHGAAHGWAVNHHELVHATHPEIRHSHLPDGWTRTPADSMAPAPPVRIPTYRRPSAPDPAHALLEEEDLELDNRPSGDR